ncbi:hypothetical protein BGZ65_012311 [Modicella reniformis]|uniref:L-ornithine N(5)-oxygenase n=1 Tax=Modicella reniformis TaxID=1440133 RepID=A0A9P6IMT4_9FUNG|nr:hypothetical protein BGZ65_012311 [Modicella reniformis]
METAMTMATMDKCNRTTARPHIVLGRGHVGGIWADMEQDHNQTLSYHEHMELPLYSFKDFLKEHPEHGNADLERPLRSTVSAYYKTYIQQVDIQSNFSDNTTVTGIYHLKDLENHCCCSMDPQCKSRTKYSGHKPLSTSMQNAHPKSPCHGTAAPCKACARFRYAILGYVETTATDSSMAKKRKRFLIRSKTVVMATGTFDQPKKLPAASVHPCTPLLTRASVGATIQQTFHDTRQLEEWMVRNSAVVTTSSTTSTRTTTLQVKSTHAMAPTAVSPPPSPSSSSVPLSAETLLSSPPPSVLITLAPPLAPALTLENDVLALSVNTTTMMTPSSTATAQLPIVIVGTGLSAADAILLIQEKQPWRRVIHIYKHFSASEPSPLKRCHRDVYPEYASVWVRMKKYATLKNSVQSYSPSSSSLYSNVFGDTKPAHACEQCKALSTTMSEHEATPQQPQPQPLCTGCSYRGLPDASVSSWDPVTGEIVIILSHGVVIQERVAAVGVFIGKQVHMGFLKGSLARELLSTSDRPTSGVTTSGIAMNSSGSGAGAGTGAGGSWNPLRRRSEQQQRGDLSVHFSNDLMVDIPTPPCSPPRSPMLRPRNGTAFVWQKQVFLAAAQGLGLLKKEQEQHQSRTDERLDQPRTAAQEEQSGARVNRTNNEEEEEDGEEEDCGDNAEAYDDKVDESQVLTLLRPLVSDMYAFRIIPTGGVSVVSPHGDSSMIGSSPVDKVATVTLPTYSMKPKRCTRLPCYPMRHLNATTVSSSSSPKPCCSEGSDGNKSGETMSQVDGLLLFDHKNPNPEQGTDGDIVVPRGRDGNEGQRTTKTMVSCISMPCSPLLGCRMMCPELGTPPLLTLSSSPAAMSLSSPMATLLLPENGSSSAKAMARTTTDTSLLTSTSFLSTNSTKTPVRERKFALMAKEEQNSQEIREQVVVVEEYARETEEEQEEEEEEMIKPLMDQSLYAAGAITGSKFVRYVLGNGVAIVADILRSEAS